MDPKILIVADDRDMQDLLIRSLAHYHLQVYTASDGSSALYQVGLTQPDLIVLDMELPDLEGWDTLQRLREISSVPVIALTTLDEEVKIESLRRGADFFLGRSFSVRELSARIYALLRRTSKVHAVGQQACSGSN